MKYFNLLAVSLAVVGLGACGFTGGSEGDIQIVDRAYESNQMFGGVKEGSDEAQMGAKEMSYDDGGVKYFYDDNVQMFDEASRSEEETVSEDGVKYFFNDGIGIIGEMPRGYGASAPKGYGGSNNKMDQSSSVPSSPQVEVYTPTNNSVIMPAPATQNYLTLPTYTGGYNATTDDSVTIYPIGGGSSGYVNPVTQTNTVGQLNYVPQSFAPVAPNHTIPTGEQIYFKHGSSHLGKSDMDKISGVAATNPGPIRVEGHASRSPGDNSVQASISNLKASMDRSFAVSKSLLKKGVPEQNLTTVSYGSARATGDAEQDRRVDIVSGY